MSTPAQPDFIADAARHLAHQLACRELQDRGAEANRPGRWRGRILLRVPCPAGHELARVYPTGQGPLLVIEHRRRADNKYRFSERRQRHLDRTEQGVYSPDLEPPDRTARAPRPQPAPELVPVLEALRDRAPEVELELSVNAELLTQPRGRQVAMSCRCGRHRVTVADALAAAQDPDRDTLPATPGWWD